MNGFTITKNQANALVDKLYEIISRKENVVIERVKKNEKIQVKKLG